MSGELTEASFPSLREDYDPEQSSLSEYGASDEPTTVAVIQEPNGTGITEVCDEWMQPLGMPKELLQEFWSLRSQYRQHDAIPYAHNKAYAEVNLDDRYIEYLRSSEEAQQCVDELIDRLEDGEDIVLVCFEEKGKCCHRHTLLDAIEERRESTFDFGFESVKR